MMKASSEFDWAWDVLAQIALMRWNIVVAPSAVAVAN
jgi:hypothetical protein